MIPDEDPPQNIPDPPASQKDAAHTESGAPTNKAHSDVGDGTLTGSVPAGLTPEEMEALARSDQPGEPGTS
ncbi:hypothetical protein C1T17_11135 [Sphingobium sp. SCG-1]|nr:hypothetical protein C1T17_11135 [Sphingobium sp. SCG-1]